MEPFSSHRRIFVLTGAGVSVASGLRTYRGPGGIWEERNVQEHGHVDALVRNPEHVWGLFGPLRETILRAQPNRAHTALAEFEARLSASQRFLLVTQNVDGLHQRAGSRNVIELHGSLARTRCTGQSCSNGPFADRSAHAEAVPHCASCGAVLRPDIVLFGERLPVEAERAARHALRECDLFIAIGTSGAVTPAAHFVAWAQCAGARTVYVNLEPMNPRNPLFGEEHCGRAEELLPQLLA